MVDPLIPDVLQTVHRIEAKLDLVVSSLATLFDSARRVDSLSPDPSVKADPPATAPPGAA